MIGHDKQKLPCFGGWGGVHSFKTNPSLHLHMKQAGVCMKDGPVSKLRPVFEIMLQWTGGRLNAGKAPLWTLSSNYPPHPPLSAPLRSLQTFCSSSLSPQIVVIKLVGFCGFEVERCEQQVYSCFLLPRERVRGVDCNRGAGIAGGGGCC